MRNQILVPLNPHDRLEDIVCYLTEIAAPGTRIVFMVRWANSDCNRLNGYLTTMETGSLAALANCKALAAATYERERQHAESRIAGFAEILRRRGLDTEVRVYSGRLKKLLANLPAGQDVRLIMMPARRNFGVFSPARLVARALRWTESPSMAPMLLLQPRPTLGESK